MKVPKLFVSEKEKGEIKEAIEKTLVEKILAEDLGKQVKEYLENQEISQRLVVIYDKFVDPQGHKTREEMKEKTKHVYLDIPSFIKGETYRILEDLLKLEPNVKEEEVVQVYGTFNIITKNVISKLCLGNKGDFYEKTKEENTLKRQRTLYHLPLIGGKVEYLKFNKEHNEKIVQVLKNRGYSVIIDFKEEKKK